MTDGPPPGPPPGPRDPADGWVELPDGRRFWGLEGAAGLLAVAPDGAILLQHRVSWSHFGGTWGLPGGARHRGESAVDGALREAEEETGIDPARLRPRFAVRLDLPGWSYTTVAARAEARLAVAVSDRESTELAWVPAAEVADRDLHPGLAASWPLLRGELDRPDPVLLVDAANVVGSRPDGWWRDRAGAAGRLLERLAALSTRGIAEGGGAGDLPVVLRWPRVVAVLEGEARAAADAAGVEVVRAPASGDDELVRVAAAQSGAVTAVTADRALADRLRGTGATVERPSWLLALLD